MCVCPSGSAHGIARPMLKVHNKAIGRLLRRSGIAGALLYLWEFNTTCHLSTGIRGDVQIRLRLCIIRAV